METFALYLFRSACWLTGFALVYILFLKNERFFEHIRIFLISGILAAFIFPFITVTYKVIIPAVVSGQSESIVADAVKGIPESTGPDLKVLLIYLYFSGVLFISLMIINQFRSIYRAIRRGVAQPFGPVKLIKSAEFDSAFSFFSYVFVNPSVTEIEIREIMNHELVHIRQKHWLDLMLASVLCVVQWFNPVIWIYFRLLRQNHEYIADKVALQRTSDPAIYRAALLNQIVGTPVISLANSFNYSVNKKRFNMMKNIINSPYRKMKILLILPVFALIFYAFAKPDYQYVTQGDTQGNKNSFSQTTDKKVSGKIVQNNDGEPLPGANVIVLGTTVGTTTDRDGNFSLKDLSDNAELAVSFVGFKSKVIKPVYNSAMTIKMMQDTINLNDDTGIPLPPPPPPPSPEAPAVAGSVPETVQPPEEPLFVVIEDLPRFPGGSAALRSWIDQNLKYPPEATQKKIMGMVYVDFTVTKAGKIQNVQVNKSVDPLLDTEAKRVVSAMPDWNPGSQNGKTVNVQMKIPVEFKLK